MENEVSIIEPKDGSNEINNVTLQKIKNPGRQEWGRKLGKMSKEMKIKKQQANIQPPSEQVSAPNAIRWKYGLGLVGILIGLHALNKYLYTDNAKDSKCPIKEEPRPLFSDF